MQKFVPGCLVRVILNERSRSTQLDPKLMFWCVFLVWVHLEPFCNCTKLGAKRARLVQLMQKFVPWCLVGIFHKERSQSTPLDPKLLFWCVYFLVGCKSSCQKVSSKFLKTDTPDPHNWTLSSCFHTFLSVWVHLGPFRYCTKLGAKRAKLVQLMQKYVPRCLVGIFHKELSRSTPLDPKLLFWCVSFLVGCIWDRFATAQNLLQNAPNWCN